MEQTTHQEACAYGASAHIGEGADPMRPGTAVQATAGLRPNAAAMQGGAPGAVGKSEPAGPQFGHMCGCGAGEAASDEGPKRAGAVFGPSEAGPGVQGPGIGATGWAGFTPAGASPEQAYAQGAGHAPSYGQQGPVAQGLYGGAGVAVGQSPLAGFGVQAGQAMCGPGGQPGAYFGYASGPGAAFAPGVGLQPQSGWRGPRPGQEQGEPERHDHCGHHDAKAGEHPDAWPGGKDSERLEHRYGQILAVCSDIMQGKADPMKIATLMTQSPTHFWKGALVGAAVTFALSNGAVKSALGDALSGLVGAAKDNGKA